MENVFECLPPVLAFENALQQNTVWWKRTNETFTFTRFVLFVSVQFLYLLIIYDNIKCKIRFSLYIFQAA